MNFTFYLPFTAEELESAQREASDGKPSSLRALCLREVDRFERYVRQADPSFSDGLVKIERLAIQGYLYQKVRGHIDAADQNPNVSKERKDGTP
jgi:hypothetical protein